MLREIFEEGRPVSPAKRRLARLDSVKEFAPRCFLISRAGHQRESAHRSGNAAAEGRGERRELEPRRLGLLENAHGGQAAKHAIQRLRLCARGIRQIFHGPRARRQQVGDPEGRDHVDHLRDPAPANQVEHDTRQRNLFFGHCPSATKCCAGNWVPKITQEYSPIAAWSTRILAPDRSGHRRIRA